MARPRQGRYISTNEEGRSTAPGIAPTRSIIKSSRVLFQQIGRNVALKVVYLDMSPFAALDLLDHVNLGTFVELGENFAVGRWLLAQMRIGMRDHGLHISNRDRR